MNKNSKFFKLKKPLIAILCAITVGSTCLAAACADDTDSSSDSSSSSTNNTREDNQLLQNGDFEYFSFPDADDGYHYIRTPNNWSRGGTTSTSMSGVISTSTTAWGKITDPLLADNLDYNNDLDSSSDDYEDEYKNYNAMESDDLLYRDAYVANLTETQLSNSFLSNVGDRGFADYFGIERVGTEGAYTYMMGDTQVYLASTATADDWKTSEFFLDEALTQPVREQFIANPGTHYDVQSDTEGLYFMDDTTRVAVLEDSETDSYYYMSGEDKVYISNILMVHNTNSYNNGISQYYSSSSITLEANTAAEISLYVKTSNLKSDKGIVADSSEQDKGAFIEVIQTVNGTDLDSFVIKSINTEKLIEGGATGSNGWLQYTILVNATDFADCTITLNLGLGYGSTSELTSGYAFFDDVVVTKSIDLSDDQLSTIDDTTTCTLTDEAEDRTFIADSATTLFNNTVGNAKYKESTPNLLRSSKDFNYYINLTSTGVSGSNTYAPIAFSSSNVTADLTYEETTNYLGNTIQYAAAASSQGTYNVLSKPATNYTLPTGLNGAAIATNRDIIGVYGANHTFAGNYASLLTTQLITNGISGLPQFSTGTNNILLMLSANGAAYTSTLNDATNFAVGADEYKIVTFWVKTSDMNGNTAATLKIYEQDNKEDTETSFTIDSSSIQTDIGEEKDIYKGWAQCFFFVHNDTTENKTFNIDFSFGATSLSTATSTTFRYGYAALANMQILNVNEDVFGMTNAGDYALSFTFAETEDDEDNTEFDSVSSTSNIKNGISDPENYSGVNGGSSLVTDNEYNEEYDRVNSNEMAGLINQEYFDEYNDTTLKNNILTSLSGAADNWNSVFGSNSYQPLVILNSLRTYSALAEATEETFKNYYVMNDDDTFTKVADTDSYNEETDYYSLSYAYNYGYISADQTIGSSSYTIISVKVMVGPNAEAHIYLVDSDSKEVMAFETPEYTYYYDDEGNVLDTEFDSDWTDGELRSHIVYTLRDDGLYEDETGKLFANLHNYIRTYKHYSFQQLEFYDAEGNRVNYDNLEDGVTYYADEAHTIKSRHYLSTSDGTRVYEYYNNEYYYLVDHTDDDDNTYKIRDEVVTNFSADYARTTPSADANEYLYHTVVEPTDGKWVTVNFIVHTGSEDKSYRLELWNGNREDSGVTINADGTVSSPSLTGVAFDYSSYSVTESNYENLLSEYEGKIIDGYKTLLFNNNLGDRISSNDENIKYYENLVADLVKAGDLEQGVVNAAQLDDSYTALYYTYSLFDSSAYIPFNADTAADGETGYEYTASSYSETLAYFIYNVKENGNITIYNTFVDYTTVDQDIENGRIEDTTTDDEDEETDNANVWLLISSIILVVVLLFTIASILFRDFMKKRSRKVSRKVQSRNNYKAQQRIIKKLGLDKDEAKAEAKTDEAKAEEAPVETVETPVEEAPAEVVEAPVETVEAPIEEAPAEKVEAPVEETPAEKVEAPEEAPKADDEGKKE